MDKDEILSAARINHIALRDLERKQDRLLDPLLTIVMNQIKAATRKAQLLVIQENLDDWPPGFHRTEIRTALNLKYIEGKLL